MFEISICEFSSLLSSVRRLGRNCLQCLSSFSTHFRLFFLFAGCVCLCYTFSISFANLPWLGCLRFSLPAHTVVPFFYYYYYYLRDFARLTMVYEGVRRRVYGVRGLCMQINEKCRKQNTEVGQEGRTDGRMEGRKLAAAQQMLLVLPLIRDRHTHTHTDGALSSKRQI